MDKEVIEDLIDKYGFEFILQDFELEVWQVLELLDELHYIDLERYVTDG